MLFIRRQLLRTLSFACGSSFILGRNQLAIAAQTAVRPKTSSLPAGVAVPDGIAGVILVNNCEMRFPRIVQSARKLRPFSDRCGEAIAEYRGALSRWRR
jgi:hypothetical protein